MDLNAQPPAIWTLEDGPYELAQHCIDKQANILLLLNAWLDSGKGLDEAKDWSTLNFWVARLRPLWARSEEFSEMDSDESGSEAAKLKDNSNGPETIVIVCNRCGEENGTSYIHDAYRRIGLILRCRPDVRWLLCDLFSTKGVWKTETLVCYG